MRRGLIMLCASLLVAGVLASVTAAASPRQIYADFAQNGELSSQYSRAELEAALKDAIAEGYGAPAGGTLKPAVREQLRRSNTLGADKQLNRTSGAGTLPFTGADLGLIALGGAALLLLGGGLRRVGRSG
jgi:hypothetical protein